MNSILEPAARRIFDSYDRYCRNSTMEELQYVFDEACKFNERLRKLPGNKIGLFYLDEFLLIKALRNHSAHKGDLLGEAFLIKRSFAEKSKLDLGKVCLIRRETVNQAINGEQRLNDDSEEQAKVRKIRGQLADFGEFYNLEPVIYNFIVKLYEKLIEIKLPVPGDGFKEIDSYYKRETYYRYDHYVPVEPVEVDSAELLENLIPIVEAKLDEQTGLPDPELDPWKEVGILDVDCASLQLASLTDYENELLVKSTISKIVKDDDAFNIAKVVPNYIGIAYITDTQNESGLFTGFSVNQQKSVFEQAGIDIDEAIYDLAPNEILVLFIFEKNILPMVIVKQDLFSAHAELIKKNRVVNSRVAKTEFSDNTDSVKNKRKKKSKRKQASASRKAQRKRKK